MSRKFVVAFVAAISIVLGASMLPAQAATGGVTADTNGVYYVYAGSYNMQLVVLTDEDYEQGVTVCRSEMTNFDANMSTYVAYGELFVDTFEHSTAAPSYSITYRRCDDETVFEPQEVKVAAVQVRPVKRTKVKKGVYKFWNKNLEVLNQNEDGLRLNGRVICQYGGKFGPDSQIVLGAGKMKRVKTERKKLYSVCFTVQGGAFASAHGFGAKRPVMGRWVR